MPLPVMQPPPAITSPAPAGQEAEVALLEAFDWERPLPADPKLKGGTALDYRWLRAAATFDPGRDLPANPSATGRKRAEAAALRRLLRTPKEQVGGAIRALVIHESGTALALWRWGQRQVKAGTFEAPVRRLWEDRLLTSGPSLTRGYALRHALCWALAEQDDGRLSSIRSTAEEDSAETLAGFQRLFGLLGGPSPVLRLWTLPGLEYQDLRLDQLGANRLWVCPAEEGRLPDLPKDTAWIIPSASGRLDEREAVLPEPMSAEAKLLSVRLQSAGRSAAFAPSQAAFERLGLNWFPILIVLDGKGGLRSVLMGDAAPAQP